MPDWALRDLTPFAGSFRTESGLGGTVQFCQLSEIYVVPWSTGGALHRSEVGEGADWSDRVRRDFDTDLIASQLGKAWYPLHSVQHLHLTVPRLDLEAGRSDQCGSGQRSLDRMFAAECPKTFSEAVHVSLVWRGNDVDVARGAHDTVSARGKPSHDHVRDVRRVERCHHAVGFEGRLSGHRPADRARTAKQHGLLRSSVGLVRLESAGDGPRSARDRSTSSAARAGNAVREGRRP